MTETRDAGDRRAGILKRAVEEPHVAHRGPCPGRHALDVAPRLAADRARHDQIDRIEQPATPVRLGNRTNTLDRTVRPSRACRVSVPGVHIVLAHVGEAEQRAVGAHCPDDLERLLGESPFLDLILASRVVDEVLAENRAVGGLPLILQHVEAELDHLVTALLHEQQRVLRPDRRQVVAAVTRLGQRDTGTRRQRRGGLSWPTPPLCARGHDQQRIAAFHQMTDGIDLPAGERTRDGVGVLGRLRHVHVVERAGVGEP